MKILVYAIGNPGRQDDGVGPLLADRLERLAASGDLASNNMALDTVTPGATCQIDFDANYQLNIEDAEAVAGYDAVFFIDASQADISGARISPVRPDSPVAFSTHALSPGGVVALAAELYDAHPAVYLVEIRGYSWEPNEQPTDCALANLETAHRLLVDEIERVVHSSMKASRV